jgi:hypothetical protein
MGKSRSGKTSREEEETKTNVIKQTIQEFCCFPEDSTMVRYMTQQ